MLRELLTRLRFLIQRRTRGEIDDELRFHLEQQVEANITAGMALEEARRQAAIAFGGVESTRESCNEQRPGYWFETFAQDVRYALRGLRKNPTFTLTVVLTLMLGIGAPTAVFSVVDRILFRSLPYAHAGQLVSVGLVAPIEQQEFMLGGSYYEWRDHQRPFEALTSEIGTSPCDLTEERPERLSCARAEANFLPTLGVHPVIGRNFMAEEDRPNALGVALISYQLWQSRFGRDPGVLNRLVSLDGQAVRVIGVLPQNFEMPRLQPADVLMPQALDEAAQRKADPGHPMWAFARLKPGVSAEQATAELQPLFEYSLRLAPAQFRKEVHLRVRSLRDRQMQDARLAAWVLFGVVIAVLLIACANVTSLMMARGAGRERELAVRSALGASRTRLARQTLTESLMLSLAGAVAGCVFAELLLRLFEAIAPEGIPFLAKARIDGRILLFSLLISLLCGVFAGIAPAMHRPRPEALAGRNSMAAPHAVMRQWLVVGQIAASMILLAAGALLFRSFWKLQNQALGMDTESIVTATISLGQKAYPTAASQMAFFQQLERGLRFGPGVTMVAISDSVPPSGYHRDQVYASLVVDGRPKWTNGTGGLVTWRWVTPDYFQTLGIRIVQGRGFTEEELNSSDHFLVLSNALATRMFSGQNPIDQRLQLAGGGLNDPWYTVVGIAADVKNGGLAGGDEAEYYRLRRNRAEDWNRGAAFLVKSTLRANVIEKWIRSQVRAIDPTQPVDVQMLSERISEMADQPRFETVLVGFFASTGLLLAIIGLYGVIAFLVAQRTQEIGVRMALGATRSDILRMVVRSGLKLIFPGVAIGLVSALATSRLLASLLFNVGPHDLGAFLPVTALLMLVALLATLIPASSAIGVDPTVALRSD
jgi:predicted permease